MTYVHDINNPYIGDIEQTHNQFATHHGRDGVFVSRDGKKIITVLGEDVGVSEVECVELVDEATAEEDSLNTYEATPGSQHVRVEFTEGDVTPQVMDVHVLDARIGANGELPHRIVDSEKHDAYVGVEAQLVPMFEAPEEIFEGIYGEFEFSLGGVGQLAGLSPTAATFRRYYRNYQYKSHREDVLSRLSENSHIEEAVVVEDTTEALETDSRATWVDDQVSSFWVYERVPFQSPATTIGALEEELAAIIGCDLGLEDVVEATPDSEIPAVA